MLELLDLERAPRHQSELIERGVLLTEDGAAPLGLEDLPSARALRGETVREALLVVAGDEGARYLRTSAAPVYDEGDRDVIRGAVVIVRDVTLEHRLAVRESDLRQRLIQIINHEFRTPLTSILGHAELLEDVGMALPAAAQRSLDRLVGASRRLAALTQAVSQLVDLQAAAQIERTYGDIAGRIRESVAARLPGALARKVEVSVLLPARLAITGDLKLLGRAVDELVDNALRHAPVGSVVSVRHEESASGLAIVVEDQGTGVSCEDRERLLEPFEVGGGSGELPTSRGLGLAYASTVALAHGGTLHLDANDPQGLRARLWVPTH
jgi:signal transduction histidine kinase